MHSGRLNLANAWIPYWKCNAEIFNKPQKGGEGGGGLGPPLNPPLIASHVSENALFYTNASVVKTLTAKDL